MVRSLDLHATCSEFGDAGDLCVVVVEVGS